MYVGCCYVVEPAASCLVVSPSPLWKTRHRGGKGGGGGEKVGQMNQGSQSDVVVLQHASHIYSGC